MPVGEIAGELLGGVLKVVGRILAEVVIELLIKGSGYLICRMFSRKVDPDGVWVIIVGVTFWGVTGFGVFWLYDYFQVQSLIEDCLDAGGRFDYKKELCEQNNNG